MTKKIEIRCRGSRALSYKQLNPFQGNLKEMSKNSSQKLRASILKYGWRFPIFVWNDGKTDWVHDGHGRLLVLGELLREGYTIAKLPVVDIEAKDRREAAKLLLAVNSKYQTITEEGLYEFMHEMNLSLDDLVSFELPDIDMEDFGEGYFENKTSEEEKPDEVEFKSRYEVCVECRDEQEQKEVYDIMTSRGYKCRVLIL